MPRQCVGVVLLRDGVPVRAGITLDAFVQLMARAGFDANHDLGVMVVDMVAMLQQTIEAYLQAKHFHVGSDQPLLIDTPDLQRH